MSKVLRHLPVTGCVGILAACAIAIAGGLTSGAAASPATASPATVSSTTTQAAGSPAGQGWLDDQESPTHIYTLQQAVTQATQFNIITAVPGTYDKYLPAMRAANPNLQVDVYMNGVLTGVSEAAGMPESWFLHDVYGNRITSSYNMYLMDPANPGWVGNRATKCAGLIAAAGYDGCFLDNLGSGTWGPGMVSATPIDPATAQNYTAGAWLARTANLASTVQSQTGKIVFANGLVSGAAFFSTTAPSSVLLNGSQIACAETFMRTSSAAIDQYRSVTQWKQDVDMLVKVSAQQQRIAVMTKVWVSGTQAQIDGWHAFALASFLLGADQNAVFQFSGAAKSNTAAGDAMMAQLGSLGLPAGPYAGASNGTYQRSFTGGLVVVNPGTTAVTTTLSKAYTDALTGASVTGSTTLQPHTGQFLLG